MASSADSVSLREYFEAILLEREKALAIKEKADERALDLARRSQEYRDEQANRLREQISDERLKYLTKTEYDDRHEELVRRIGTAENSLAAGGGRTAGIDKLIAYGITAAAVIVAIISQLH